MTEEIDVNSELNISISYEKEHDLIIINFEQDGRTIITGFNIAEAQNLQLYLADAITEAILDGTQTAKIH